MLIHDLIGIGFGPSNIALAIALQEQGRPDEGFLTLFIEKQEHFAWHPDMLLDDAYMQVSYLKDLATLRNPRSRFTFLNYLYEQGRLPAFINRKTFFPSRKEFNSYLAWAATQFNDICAYGEEVVEVLPWRENGQVQLLQIRSRDTQGVLRDRWTRNLVVGVGGTASVPAVFEPLVGNERVFHSSRYLTGSSANRHARRIAVVGAGQSAAEIFMDQHGRDSSTEIDLILRGRAIRPSDDSPFVNEIFNGTFTDYMFEQDDATRALLLQEFRHTNYAVADLELIERIYNVLYEQRVSGAERHRLLCRHEIVSANAAEDGIEMRLRDLDRDAERLQRYDAVILATGYERQPHKTLLAPVAEQLGELAVDRQYRVRTPANFRPGIFLQGACEASHGLSDTLLSVIALRVQEILGNLAPAARRPLERAARSQATMAG